MSISKRIRALLSKSVMTITRLAQELETPRQSIYHWLNGRNRPNRENIEKIAAIFKVDPDWLETGNATLEGESVTAVEDIPETDDQYVFIPEYELVFGCHDCGVDAPIWVETKDVPKAAYRLDFFHEHHAKPGSCIRVRAHGDSMEPLILDGDKVLIRKVAEGEPIIDGRIYAISYGGALRIKRLFQRANGDLVIHSENPLYKDEELTAEEADQLIRIHGLVIDRSGSIR